MRHVNDLRERVIASRECVKICAVICCYGTDLLQTCCRLVAALLQRCCTHWMPPLMNSSYIWGVVEAEIILLLQLRSFYSSHTCLLSRDMCVSNGVLQLVILLQCCNGWSFHSSHTHLLWSELQQHHAATTPRHSSHTFHSSHTCQICGDMCIAWRVAADDSIAAHHSIRAEYISCDLWFELQQHHAATTPRCNNTTLFEPQIFHSCLTRLLCNLLQQKW